MNFTIVSQCYMPNSNGIKVLHKICDALNRFGHDARMLYLNPHEANSQDFINPATIKGAPDLNAPILKGEDKSFIADSIVVYPEVVIANPLNAKKVVRYFGNRESYCNGRTVMAGSKDFIVAHSCVIHPKPDYVLFSAEVNPCFNGVGARYFEERTMDVTYIGKGYIYGNVGIIPNTVYIAREWPTTQEQLAILMRQTRFFYTWDAWTSTNMEAVLCGAVPVILHYDPWKPEELDASELGLPRAEIVDGEVKLDADKFLKERIELMKKIDVMTISWDDRVREFAGKVEEHFK